MLKKRCRKNKPCYGVSMGPILISVGIGVFIAYIIPNYVLITMLGLSLIVVGIKFVIK